MWQEGMRDTAMVARLAEVIRRGLFAMLLCAVVGLSQGCSIAGLALGSAASLGAGAGTSYTLSGIAYRTFTEPMAKVRKATVTCLTRMDITLQTDEVAPEGRAIVGKAGEHTVYVDLERLTSRTTRMRVTVKRGVFFRDRATAGEIVAQTERALQKIAAPRKEASIGG